MLSVSVNKKLGVLDFDLSFDAPARGVTALSGPSGAGKSTVINMISGLLKPDSGTISLQKRLLFDSNKRINVPVEQRRIGYVFQDALLFPHMNVMKNLTYGMKRLPRSQRNIPFDHVVSLLGLSHLLKRGPASLSGGEKQRVAIGRAILTSPMLLVMDEPLASLDQQRKDDVLPYIKEVSSDLEIPIVYVSHSAQEIATLTDRVVCIEAGRSVAGQRTSASDGGGGEATSGKDRSEKDTSRTGCECSHAPFLRSLPFDSGSALYKRQRVYFPYRHPRLSREMR
jgi:molybdate transport system ATP-binding protein